jgi:NADPH:quinone reductase-like Zn-dependent oxidoreductase
MRALRIPSWGSAPVLEDVAEPVAGPGEALVRVTAAALNPVDLTIASGRFYMPLPDPPITAGCEVVGEAVSSATHPAGTRVWCLPVTGGLAERTTAPDGTLAPVPEGLDDATAAALGVAGLAGWMPVLDRGALRPGETVVVLGASGVVGQVAVQAARHGGAARVVAVARSAAGRERALALGADVAVATGEGLAGALREACPDGADLVVDALWGASAVAALGALRHGGRLVQVGNAEASEATLAPGVLRGRRADVRGFSVLVEQHADLRRWYADLAAAAAGGEVAMEIEAVPLEEAPAAWARQGGGTGGVKLVVEV